MVEVIGIGAARRRNAVGPCGKEIEGLRVARAGKMVNERPFPAVELAVAWKIGETIQPHLLVGVAAGGCFVRFNQRHNFTDGGFRLFCRSGISASGELPKGEEGQKIGAFPKMNRHGWESEDSHMAAPA